MSSAWLFYFVMLRWVRPWIVFIFQILLKRRHFFYLAWINFLLMKHKLINFFKAIGIGIGTGTDIKNAIISFPARSRGPKGLKMVNCAYAGGYIRDINWVTYFGGVLTGFHGILFEQYSRIKPQRLSLLVAFLVFTQIQLSKMHVAGRSWYFFYIKIFTWIS